MKPLGKKQLWLSLASECSHGLWNGSRRTEAGRPSTARAHATYSVRGTWCRSSAESSDGAAHTHRVPGGRWFQASQINEYSKIARCHGNSEPPFVCCWKLRRSTQGSGRAVNRLSGGVRLCAAGASRAFDGVCDTVSGQTAARTASGGRNCPRAVAVHTSPRLVPLLSSHVSSQCGHALSIGFVCPFPALTAR